MGNASRTREVPPTDDEAEAGSDPPGRRGDPGEGQPLEIRRVALGELHLDPANTRRHPDRNIAGLIASLKEFGQVEPLVVHKGTGKVIGGNGRLTAMLEMGLTECDIVEVDADHVRAAALGITLNRSAETAEWDFEGLGATIRALQEEEFDISILGWADHELEPILAADWSPPAVGPLPSSGAGKDGDGADELVIDATGSESIRRAIAKAREVAGDLDLAPLACLEMAADAFVMAEVL